MRFSGQRQILLIFYRINLYILYIINFRGDYA